MSDLRPEPPHSTDELTAAEVEQAYSTMRDVIADLTVDRLMRA